MWGIAFYRGSVMAVNEINKAGGVLAEGRRWMLELVPYDDKYLADEGVSIANKLVFDDKVKFIACTGGSAPTLAALPIYTKNKVLHMDGGCFSDLALGPHLPYTFRPTSTSAYYVKPLVKNWREVFPEETKRVAIINANDPLGWTVQKQTSYTWKKQGAEVVADVLYELTTTDFTPLLTTILAKKPTFLDTASTYPAHQGMVVQTARELGYKGLIGTLSYEIPADMKKFVKPEYLEGYMFMYYAFHLPDATPRQKAYYAEWMRLFGEPFLPGSMLSYCGFQPLVMAIQKANSLDPDKVIPVLETLEWDSILGPAKWGGKDVFGINHEMMMPVQMCQVKGGDVVLFKTVYPESYLAE